MTNQNQEVTPEQYKNALLKQNTARRFADYEDTIAGLQTRIAMLEQQLEAQNADSDVEQAPDELPAPPAPPAAE